LACRQNDGGIGASFVARLASAPLDRTACAYRLARDFGSRGEKDGELGNFSWGSEKLRHRRPPIPHSLPKRNGASGKAQVPWVGRGSYQRTRLDRFNLPQGYLAGQKQVRGFRTDNGVRAEVPAGRKAGAHIGRVAVRASSSFNIRTPQDVAQGINARHCTRIQRADGYGSHQPPKIAIDTKEDAAWPPHGGRYSSPAGMPGLPARSSGLSPRTTTFGALARCALNHNQSL
jgi:hypothetical protein